MLQKHVSFEINRFRATALLWGGKHYGELADAMIRESCLIHLRLLLDFFYPRREEAEGKNTDVFASDYLPHTNLLAPAFRTLLAKPTWLKEYQDQLDWRLAHLTLHRLTFEQRPAWAPSKQFAHVEQLIEQFLAALPSDMRALFSPNQQ
jgi:hypothetical protein